MNENKNSKLAVYPGSFDPITYGHLDIIRRARNIFGQVVVAITRNFGKNSFLDLKEREKLVRQSLDELNLQKNVKVDVFDGLLVDYLKKINANIVIRGIRFISDFEYEFQMALINRHLYSKIETVYLMPDERYLHLSSSIVREIALLGSAPRDFVPACVASVLSLKIKKTSRIS
ncbi:MAG: pantetheine-phosphate adenylyltransferase [Elusimicrobia bacterium]|nr:pantetheine-phosphate adenylyltransferase [Elusimicrobiota bacterium]